MPTDSITHPSTTKTLRLQPNRTSFDTGGDTTVAKFVTYHEALEDPYSQYASPFLFTLDPNALRNNDNQKKIFFRQPGVYQITASMCKSGAYSTGVRNAVRIILYNSNGVLNRELAYGGEEYLTEGSTIIATTTVRLTPSDFAGANPYIEIVIRGNGILLGWNPSGIGGAGYDDLGRTGSFVEVTLHDY